MMNKVTNKMAYEYAIAMLKGEEISTEINRDEVIEKFEKMLEQNIARASRDRTPSKKELEEKQKKLDRANATLEAMEVGKMYTSADLMEEFGFESVSAVTYAMKSFVESGVVVKNIIKRKTHYSKA